MPSNLRDTFPDAQNIIYLSFKVYAFYLMITNQCHVGIVKEDKHSPMISICIFENHGDIFKAAWISVFIFQIDFDLLSLKITFMNILFIECLSIRHHISILCKKNFSHMIGEIFVITSGILRNFRICRISPRKQDSKSRAKYWTSTLTEFSIENKDILSEKNFSPKLCH